MNPSLLDIQDLHIRFDTARGISHAVDGVSLNVKPGEVLGIVGESGCGKSITCMAAMGLLPENTEIQAGRCDFNEHPLLDLSEGRLQKIRGSEMAMIFQDPMTSLNPSFTVGFQLCEVLEKKYPSESKEKIHHRAYELLEKVGISEAKRRLRSYPHQLSGGMNQRIMIAMALAGEPKLLIADEPTTALDVTIQAQILRLLKDIQKENGMALILITHDLGVVSQMADRLIVMYAGQVVEEGPTQDIIRFPKHPYTEGLLTCLPSFHQKEDEHRSRLPSIPGVVVDLVERPVGCQLAPRCTKAQERCHKEKPNEQILGQQKVHCFYPSTHRGSA